MSKRFTAFIPCLVPLLFLAIFTFVPSGPAHGTPITYGFLATSQQPSKVSDFTLSYMDNDGDSHFDLSELVPNSFSGVTVQSELFSTLVAVPLHSADSPMTDGTYATWKFQGVPC